MLDCSPTWCSTKEQLIKSTEEFCLEGEEFIELQALLKVTGFCDTGGDAKAAIVAGQVKVDDQVETRRGKKIRAGQKVQMTTKQVLVKP